MTDWAPNGTDTLPAGGAALTRCAMVATAGFPAAGEAAAAAGAHIGSLFCALGFSSAGRRSYCAGICSGSRRLLSAWGKRDFVGAGLLSLELGTGFSVTGALLSSVLPHDLRQSLGGAVVTGAGVFTVVT